MKWFGKGEIVEQCFFVLLLTATVVFHTSGADPHGLTSTDSSVFEYVGMVMQHGGTPYIDTFDHKGPFIYLINYLGLEFFCWRGFVVFEAISIAVALFFMFQTARLWTSFYSASIIVAGCTAILYQYFLGGGNFVEEYALPWIALSTFLFLRYLQEGNIDIIQLFLLGFSMSMVCLLRPNMIAVWVVGYPVLFWIQVRHHRWKRALLFSIAGIVAGMAPFIFWLAAKGALQAFWDAYIVFNVQYTALARSHARLKELTEMLGIDFQMPDRWETFRYFVTKGAVEAAALCGCAMYLQKERVNLAIWAGLLMIPVSLLMVCVSGLLFSHYGMVLVPVLVAPMAFFMGFLEEGRFKQSLLYHQGMKFLGILFVAGLAISSGSQYWQSWQRNLPSEEEAAVRDLASYIRSHSDEDDRIFVCGNEDILYVQSKRLSASRYSYQFSVVIVRPESRDEYYAELEKNPPRIFVVANFGRELVDDWLRSFFQRHGYVRVPEQENQIARQVYELSD